MNEQFEKYAAPVKQLNELNVKNAEALIEMQIKQNEENTKAGFEQFKGASQITDADSLKSFFESQAAFTQALNAQAVENTRSMIEMGNAYASEVQNIVRNAFAVK